MNELAIRLIGGAPSVILAGAAQCGLGPNTREKE